MMTLVTYCFGSRLSRIEIRAGVWPEAAHRASWFDSHTCSFLTAVTLSALRLAGISMTCAPNIVPGLGPNCSMGNAVKLSGWLDLALFRNHPPLLMTANVPPEKAPQLLEPAGGGATWYL